MGFLNALTGSTGYSYNTSESQSENSGWSFTNGTEANEQAIKNAAAANALAISNAMQQQQFNASEAQKNRDFQLMMSNTAYQRAMADMEKAGLNPILAYMQGGASTPGGSTASGSMAGVSQANTFANSMSQNSGKSTSQGKGESWSNSGLAEGLTQMGKFIGDAINMLNSGKGLEQFTSDVEGLTDKAKEEVKDVYEDVEPVIKDTFLNLMKTFGLWKVTKGKTTGKNVVNQLPGLDDYINNTK